MPTGPRRGQEGHAYLSMCLLLPNKAVGRHPELGHACVPEVFDECPDGVCFGDVVRSTEDTQTEALGKLTRQGRSGRRFKTIAWGQAKQLCN